MEDEKIWCCLCSLTRKSGSNPKFIYTENILTSYRDLLEYLHWTSRQVACIQKAWSWSVTVDQI